MALDSIEKSFECIDGEYRMNVKVNRTGHGRRPRCNPPRNVDRNVGFPANPTPLGNGVPGVVEAWPPANVASSSGDCRAKATYTVPLPPSKRPAEASSPLPGIPGIMAISQGYLKHGRALLRCGQAPRHFTIPATPGSHFMGPWRILGQDPRPRSQRPRILGIVSPPSRSRPKRHSWNRPRSYLVRGLRVQPPPQSGSPRESPHPPRTPGFNGLGFDLHSGSRNNVLFRQCPALASVLAPT